MKKISPYKYSKELVSLYIAYLKEEISTVEVDDILDSQGWNIDEALQKAIKKGDLTLTKNYE